MKAVSIFMSSLVIWAVSMSAAQAISEISVTKNVRGTVPVSIAGEVVRVKNNKAIANVRMRGVDDVGTAVDFIGVLQFQGDIGDGTDLVVALDGKGRTQFMGSVMQADGTTIDFSGKGRVSLQGTVSRVLNSDGSFTATLDAQGVLQFQGDVLDGTDL